MDDVSREAEHELLLLCTQAPFDEGSLARIEDLLDAAVDWTYLVETSIAHAVTPMLCRALDMVRPALVPVDVLAAAKTRLAENRIHNGALTTELLRILDALDNAGISAIPFKGPALAEICYGDSGLRSYRDLDFLVAKDAAAETVTVLRGLGYTGTGQISSKQQDFELSPRQDAALWHYAGEYLFFHTLKEVAIEPHWAFVPPTLGLDLDYEGIRERARHGVLMGRTVRMLSPEDTVFGLALHGAKEYWSRLQWIADLDRAMKHEAALDWDMLLAGCRRSGTLRILLVGLQLVRTAFGTDLDARAASAIEGDPVAQRLAGRRFAALFDDAADHHSNAVLSAEWLSLLPDFRNKLKYVFRTAITPRVQHFEGFPLPDCLFPAYYAVKPAHDYIALPLWLLADKLGVRRGGHRKS